ncbi:MAG: PHP domain-containing protein [Deltaproteobacteria bacterium]|nr:PHP domain-containing protein [Deltaproteobacteria bacterium]
MLIDLHTHTKPKSDDSFLSPSELIVQAKKAGLDGICLTEHDWFWSPEDLKNLSKAFNYLIIPGVEINTDDGHFIVFGIDAYEFGMHRTAFLRDVVDAGGGFMIFAHPYRRNFSVDDDIDEAVERCCRKSVLQYVDTIEILNGQGKEKQNEFSKRLAYRLGWKGVGGSDAHELKDIPSYATRFERRIGNREELIRELKAGRYRAVTVKGKD